MSEAKENGTPEKELIWAVLEELDGKTADDVFDMKEEIERFVFSQ